MDLVCGKCHSKFRIADEKLPEGKLFSVKCPKCKSKMDIDSRLGIQVDKRPGTLQSLIDDMASDTYDAGLAPFEFVEEGVRTALVCEQNEEARGQVCAALEQLEFNVTAAESTRDALRFMRFHVFDLIALDESFDGADLDSNHMLQYLGQFPIGTRRNIFVVLLSNEFKTGDRMAAFNRSVNLVVNLAEVDGLEIFLKHGLKESEDFYGILKEGLKKLGRL